MLISQRETLETTHGPYNDSQWHVVSVTHNAKLLRLVVDDIDSYSTDTAPEPLHILQGVLFVGGVQPNYVVGGKMASKVPFEGCIADATVNSRVLNLLEPYSNQSVTFGRCGATTTTGGPPPARPEPSVEQEPAPAPPQPSSTRAPFPRTPPAAVPPATPPAATTPTPAPAPPQPEAGCALAYDPLYDIGTPDEGYRFGTRSDSHIRYAKLPGRQTEEYDLTISFRTFDQHGGLMFYAADSDQTNFLAVYMKDAQLHLAFSCGSDTGLVVSTELYNDTLWHAATVVRHRGHGKLTVDGDRLGEASVTCAGPALLTAPYYYGGLSNVTDTIKHHLEGFYQPFKGCLKGLRMNDQPAWEVQERVNSLRCTDHVEAGVYFGPSSDKRSNYLKLQERFKVGYEISISMEIKPRNSTGLLFSVHGKTDFMVIELLENQVVANVENGKGPFYASYKLGSKTSLCDGQWHKIHAAKSRHVVSVGVDGHFSDAGVGQSGSTDTRSALYIGGHQRSITKVRGVTSTRGFTGCIRNIKIRDSPVHIPLSAAGRNTHIGVCPKD